jgi:hypothetical protein
VPDFETIAKKIIESIKPKFRTRSPSEHPLREALEKLDGEVIKVNPRQYPSTDSLALRELDDATRLQVEEAVVANGVEGLACYKSLHLVGRPPFPGKWGIFIFDYALPYLAPEINLSDDGLSPEDCRSQAFNFLYYHERFHFLFDAWVISHEAVNLEALYMPYQDHVYWAVHPSELCVEESLANRYALRKCRRIERFLSEFLEEQPDAYANFQSLADDKMPARLAAQVFRGSEAITSVPPLELYEHVAYLGQERGNLVRRSQCPVYIVLNADPAPFRVPLFPLPNWKEIRDGFVITYLSGQPLERTDHEFFRIDNGKKVKIPNRHGKDRIRHDEFRNIRNKAGVTTREYYDERKRTNGWREARAMPKQPLVEPKGPKQRT